jgi:predicted regulator of Ras-like GTPase activity (Roadblock/LC7/MglB family)
VDQTVVEMRHGTFLVVSVSFGSALAVLAAPNCDMGLVSYEMALLVDRVGRGLTPSARSGGSDAR